MNLKIKFINFINFIKNVKFIKLNFFFAGACVMVVIQVLLSSIEFQKHFMPEIHPHGAITTYDFSLILAWLVFIINLLSGCAFMLFSKKRKRDKAPTEEIAMADEPTIIGR